MPGNADDEIGGVPVTPAHLLTQLVVAGIDAPASLVCEVELTRFDAEQQGELLPVLWEYILAHRDSTKVDRLAAAGSAIRKYIAIMPMEQVGDLSVLIESGHRTSLPIELEIEVAKMIYRNFETHPPVRPDPHPHLAQQLWEMVQLYTHPRLLLRGKYSAVASLSIQAMIAMRSSLAGDAWRRANDCPYRWFAELVGDAIERLRICWDGKDPDAANWLLTLRTNDADHALAE